MNQRRRSILITGGTRGIGLALVNHYQQAGWRVITCARSRQAVARQGASGVEAFVCDVAAADDRRHLVERVGRLDGLINNAAVQGSEALHATTDDTLEHEVRVNLIGPLALGHALLPQMNPGGFIANVSSGLAYVPLGRSPVYCATKAGLSMYTRSARLQRPGVRLVEVVLPLVDTEMTAGRGRDKLAPEEAALQIAAGIARGDETVRVGKARLLPMMLRLAPRLMAHLLNRGEQPTGAPALTP